MPTKTSKLNIRFLFIFCIISLCNTSTQAITIWLQSQIDSFAIDYPNVTTFNGDIRIREANPGTITNLNGLIQLKRIKGYLRIYENANLVDLSGLDSLSKVDEKLTLFNNEHLVSIEALSNLSYVEDLEIHLNRSLKNLKGLEGIQIIDRGLDIWDNDKLESLSGLDNLRYVGQGLDISDNLIIVNLEGLNQLEVIKSGLNFRNNKSLESLDGLDQLRTVSGYLIIQGNPKLINLKALSNFTDLGGSLLIDNNMRLRSLTGLQNLKPALLTGIGITNCPRLAHCAFDGICDYLTGQTASIIDLSFNNCGCSDLFELENACQRFRGEVTNTECRLMLYPNPTNTNSIVIKKKSKAQTIKRIEIIDNMGKVLLSAESEHSFLDITKLTRGAYNVRILVDDEVQTLRFLKE